MVVNELCYEVFNLFFYEYENKVLNGNRILSLIFCIIKFIEDLCED